MTRILTTILLFFSTLTFGQKVKERIEITSIQLINDIITSTDFSFQIQKLSEIKNDSFLKVLCNISDTSKVDTILRTKFRLSMGDFIEITEDTLNLIDCPYFNKYKQFIPLEETTDFTLADINFMKIQKKSNKKIRWDKRINATSILKAKEIEILFKSYGGWNMFHQKFGKNFVKFSVPLFNITYTKAIIIIDYSCGGLCGYGGEFLCEKINGKWIIVKTFGSQWVN